VIGISRGVHGISWNFKGISWDFTGIFLWKLMYVNTILRDLIGVLMEFHRGFEWDFNGDLVGFSSSI
jgi:hypothetical protein